MEWIERSALPNYRARVMRIFDPVPWRFLLVPLAVLLVAATTAPYPAPAQTNYPNRPVRVVVPFAAGGVADSTARIVADKLAEKLGQRFYVENQPGAGGITAARTALGAAPDGYTLIMLTNGTAVSVSLFEKLPFDPVKDFTPVSSLGFFDFAFVTSTSSGFKTLGDFIAAAKAKPGALNVGTINVGSTQNLSAELFKTAANIDFTLVPFRGNHEAEVALLQGNLSLVIDSYSVLQGNIDDGKLRALASSGAVRSESTPELRTVQESGVSGLRCRILERAVRARRHAARNHQDAECSLAGYSRRSRDQKEVSHARHRSESRHAGGDRGPAEIRHRQVARRDREGENSETIGK